MIALATSFILGLMSAAMGAVVWRGPPPNAKKPVQEWMARVLILVVLIAATSLAGFIYRQANSQAMAKAAESYGVYE